MKMHTAISVFFALCLLAPIHAQINPNDIYRTPDGRDRSPRDIEMMKRIYANQISLSRSEPMRTYSLGRSGLNSESTAERRHWSAALQSPGAAEMSAYAAFLKLDGTGFSTLLTGDDCSRSEIPKGRSDRKQNCAEQVLPGKGSFYSFRKKEYAPAGLADLGFKEDWFLNVGYATQTILTDLGDVPVNSLDLHSPGLGFLTVFVPAASLEAGDKQQAELENGVLANGYVYYKAVKAVPGHTYALRSIAYRGKLIYDIELGKEHYKFDLLGNDVRGDKIVIFRFTGKDDRGNAKIIWRVLSSGESPKLDLPVLKPDSSQIKVRRVDND